MKGTKKDRNSLPVWRCIFYSGLPAPESTLAGVNINHHGRLSVAGGPEPRKDRACNQPSLRESPHPMIRVGSPYMSGHRTARAKIDPISRRGGSPLHQFQLNGKNG
jgi:hypothetical protein